ncbi:hypothetical protein CLOM_g19361 [Closterium sp. NIES-68]|nr:hypothetical protein CLOM_g19361 [Closterium sp. NIES-68]GJP76859.1 hypothetical protein CLOP_g7309 [Closterium sp. NIES-67]
MDIRIQALLLYLLTSPCLSHASRPWRSAGSITPSVQAATSGSDSEPLGLDDLRPDPTGSVVESVATALSAWDDDDNNLSGMAGDSVAAAAAAAAGGARLDSNGPVTEGWSEDGGLEADDDSSNVVVAGQNSVVTFSEGVLVADETPTAVAEGEPAGDDVGERDNVAVAGQNSVVLLAEEARAGTTDTAIDSAADMRSQSADVAENLLTVAAAEVAAEGPAKEASAEEVPEGGAKEAAAEEAAEGQDIAAEVEAAAEEAAAVAAEAAAVAAADVEKSDAYAETSVAAEAESAEAETAKGETTEARTAEAGAAKAETAEAETEQNPGWNSDTQQFEFDGQATDAPPSGSDSGTGISDGDGEEGTAVVRTLDDGPTAEEILPEALEGSEADTGGLSAQ